MQAQQGSVHTSGEIRPVSVQKLAADTGVSFALVYNRVRAGEIRSTKIGNRILIPRSEYNRLMFGETSQKQ